MKAKQTIGPQVTKELILALGNDLDAMSMTVPKTKDDLALVAVQELDILRRLRSLVEKRLDVIEPEFKRTTGERFIGPYRVLVTSSDQERLDQDEAKHLILDAGLKVPMKKVPQVRLTIERYERV